MSSAIDILKYTQTKQISWKRYRKTIRTDLRNIAPLKAMAG